MESLLSKCKENIKANKQKTAALTEVKEQLASDLALREKELAEERAKTQDVNAQLELLKGRYRSQVLGRVQKFFGFIFFYIFIDRELVHLSASHAFIYREAGEELQMAEVKLAMHKEMLGKDEVSPGAIPRRY